MLNQALSESSILSMEPDSPDYALGEHQRMGRDIYELHFVGRTSVASPQVVHDLVDRIIEVFTKSNNNSSDTLKYQPLQSVREREK